MTIISKGAGFAGAMQMTFLVWMAALGGSAAIYSALSLAGLVPWLQTPVTFGTWHFADAGIAIQLLAAAALMSTTLLLPGVAAARVRRHSARAQIDQPSVAVTRRMLPMLDTQAGPAALSPVAQLEDERRSRIATAQQACAEIKHWSNRFMDDEATIRAQLDQLDAELQQVLPALGYEFTPAAPATLSGNVIPLRRYATD